MSPKLRWHWPTFCLKKATRPKRRVRYARLEKNFGKEGLGDDEILADTLLARVLLSQRKVADAEKETSAARNLLAKSQDFRFG
jgi:hypothetical protein